MEEKTVSKVTVEIFGVNYGLKTADDPEHLKEVAKSVDTRIRLMAQKTRCLDNRTVAVLTALELQEELCQLRKDYDELLELFQEK